ncbi:MAG: hypothetical protein SFU98_09105 [Leptospiraceae bacterium]|nr:hypothetical protein [Leptospiraceae bacterium]
MLGMIQLEAYTAMIAAAFGYAAFKKSGRATHKFGAGASGKIKILNNPNIPANEFFEAGKEFPCKLRHGTVSFEDEAAKDIRSASIKFSLNDEDAPLDLIMNTGDQGFFNAIEFWQFTMASVKNIKPDEPSSSEGLKELFTRDKLQSQLFEEGLRRAPSSFSQLYYHTQLINYYKSKDGVIRYAKYRLAPEDKGIESGLPVGEDAKRPWDQKRFPDEKKENDYLRKEFLDRISKQKIIYHLQVQLRTDDGKSSLDKTSLFRQEVEWEAKDYPWEDLALIILDKGLTLEETEKLQFNVGRQPSSLGIIPADSPEDPRSINHIRARVYKVSQMMRFLRY